MNKKFLIRRAEIEDLPKIQEIEIKSFSRPYNEDFFYSLWKNNATQFYVAELEKKIVGYIIGLRRDWELGHVVSIAIDPEHRKRGLGTLLITRLVEDIKTKVIQLEVSTKNIDAHFFYKSLGFKSNEVISNYYQNGEDAIRMFLKTDQWKKTSDQVK